MNVEPQIQRNHRHTGLSVSYMQIFDMWKVSVPNLHVVQNIYDETLISHEKEENPAFSNNAKGEPYGNLNKPGRKRQIM